MKRIAFILLFLLGCNNPGCNNPPPRSNDWVGEYYFEELTKVRAELGQCRAETPVINISMPAMVEMKEEGQTLKNSVFVASNLTDEQIKNIKDHVAKVLETHFAGKGK